ncbi:MAG TPA: hypothetical protein VLE97_04820 [Gaiellaceae bacterium]|nr:hypothetical protein [Gaiellaceae bacterium]
MAEFDPTVIERHAAYLYRRAVALSRGSMVAGVGLGAVVGAYPLTTWSHWPVPHMFGVATLLFGALAGGLIGYVVGDFRAEGVRLQAQLVLHQLQLERNTAAIAETLMRQVEQLPFVASPPRLVENEPLELDEPPVSAAIELQA